MPQGKVPPRGFMADFLVHASTKTDAYIYVSGNCEELGMWNPDNAVALNKVLDGDVIIPYHTPRTGNAWKVSIHIGSLGHPEELLYKYFIGLTAVDGSISVYRLEGHSPRRFKPRTGDPEIDQPDLFAVFDEESSSITGYLNDRTTVDFTFDPAAVTWTGAGTRERKFRVRFEHAEPVRYNLQRRPEFKVARYFKEEITYQFTKQSKHGPLLESQPLLYRCSMNVNEACNVRIDFYEIKAGKNRDVPPNYFAYVLVSGSLLKGSHGRLLIPIRMPTRHEVMRITDCGLLELQYTVIRSCPAVTERSAKRSIFRPIELVNSMLHIGHRGCGTSYPQPGAPNSSVCENTIASFNRAAECGADFVEFDVMLDVDAQPIVYHDHTVLVKGIENHLNELAVKDLLAEHLSSDKVFHISETDGKRVLSKSGWETPFPTLLNVFKYVNKDVGFNIELKYPMMLVNGNSELNPTADSTFRKEYKEMRLPYWNKNVFVDGILHVVLGCAGSRPLVFSSFDLDCCTMLRLKQVQYPVYLLTSDDGQNGPQYEDVRLNYLKRAVYSAAAYELDGVVVTTAALFRHSWFIPLTKKFRLAVMVYGETNNSVQAIRDIKNTGAMKGIIYDRIYDFIAETKDNYKPRIIPPCNPAPPLNCRDYAVGYTGYIPGKLSAVGGDSALGGNLHNSKNPKCQNKCV